ncbi:MAG: sigma-70 family RNA polymerase sigma factor [candidate division WOR-3 bacterium]
MNKEKELEIIYKKFSKDVYSYLLFLSLSREEAEDILQDVFIKFWKLFDRLKNLENIKAYLLKMARNRLIDLKRREKNIKFVELNEEIFDIKSEDPADKIKKIEFVKKILENLEEEEREIIILRFYENLKFREISEILSINENTLRVKYLRILEKIRKYVYNYNYEK